ncbi:hypothetical protein HMPREF9318_00103 [Streptococcus urinalis FB127-CNA-2]|nr:hypothetical protein HMPREF9318_00103 [Streptococcus urinalis FB127-CNA-2]VEF31718.1 Uncharacterised protein [Streptococcus urinalis]
MMKILQNLHNKLERGKLIMIMLFALNVVYNNYPWKPIPAILKPKIKEQIILIVGADNMELVNQLTKED